MLERTIAKSSSEQMVMGTPKEMHDGGFLGLRAAFFPLHRSSKVPRKGRRWRHPALCEGWLNLIEFD